MCAHCWVYKIIFVTCQHVFTFISSLVFIFGTRQLTASQLTGSQTDRQDNWPPRQLTAKNAYFINKNFRHVELQKS